MAGTSGLVRRFTAVLVAVAIGVLAAAAPANATAAPVTITVSADRSAIRADGVDSATVTVDASLTNGGAPLAGASINLSAVWSTPRIAGAAKFVPKPLVLDANGHGVTTLTSLRSGTMQVRASISTTSFKGTGYSAPIDATRHSIVAFASGAASTVTCTSPGVCGDPYNLLGPVRDALASYGFAPVDLPQFSYAGGTVDPVTHGWLPNPSVCADSAVSYKTQIGRMTTMLKKLASANPNTDFSVVGISQGALLSYQMLGTAAKLPKGSRLAGVYPLDGPLGGVPLAQLLQLESEAPTACWSQGGAGTAAQQLVGFWNTTAPLQGVDQADHTVAMCSYVLMTICGTKTNQDLLTSALARGTIVQTWGSSDDGVFYPPACGVPGTWADARSTQVVTGAGGGLHPEGGTSNCLGSHVIVISNRAAGIAASIGPQQ